MPCIEFATCVAYAETGNDVLLPLRRQTGVSTYFDAVIVVQDSNVDDSVGISVVNFGEKLPRFMHECITQNIGESNQNSALDKKYDQDDRVTGSLHSRTKATHTDTDVCENEWDTWEMSMSSYVVDNG